MAAPVWPASLPQAQTGLGGGMNVETFHPAPHVSEFEVGERARQSSSVAMETLSLTWPTMTPAQLATLRGFAVATLKHGTLWFDCPIHDGASSTVKRVRLTGAGFAARDEGDRYRVSATVKVDPGAAP